MISGKGKKGNLDKYIGLIGALAGVVIFGSIYVDLYPGTL